MAWLRGPLRKVLRGTFLDMELMEPLSVKLIERTLQEFEAGINAHESRLWALLMFGYWRFQKYGDHGDHVTYKPVGLS